jgi:Flp pilus assembly protein TadG
MTNSESHRLKRLLRRLPLARLVRDRSGVSAVEFALILPVMLTLYIGGVEVSEGLSIDRKVNHVTSTLADLVTQSKSLSDSDVTNIFDASSAVMAPYPAGPLQITVYEIYVDSTGAAKVVWSAARNATAPVVGSAVTLPASVAQTSTHIVAAVAQYPYTPVIGYVLTGSFTLSSTYYLRPRLSTCVTTSTYTTCKTS